eukprot:TRINITY_DN36604_c0_g1_i1.p1 TRINITY_DN36604_c0_g1~~TRINITY_DN36604_c0_g1_i1.p1  ORF type:complete len:276 (+),score=83.02 TRINITY_DN36604_c0_g1_i1:77-829(+)
MGEHGLSQEIQWGQQQQQQQPQQFAIQQQQPQQGYQQVYLQQAGGGFQAAPGAPTGGGGSQVGVSGGGIQQSRGRVRPGFVKRWNLDKGYGFIQPIEGGDDVFVHHSVVHSKGFRSLLEGSEVEYECMEIAPTRVRATRVSGPGGTYCKPAPRPANPPLVGYTSQADQPQQQQGQQQFISTPMSILLPSGQVPNQGSQGGSGGGGGGGGNQGSAQLQLVQLQGDNQFQDGQFMNSFDGEFSHTPLPPAPN